MYVTINALHLPKNLWDKKAAATLVMYVRVCVYTYTYTYYI